MPPILLPPIRVDRAVVALRRVVAESRRLREALEKLDEAGGLGRAAQVSDEVVHLGRTARDLRETRDGLTRTLGRIAGVVRAGSQASG